MQGSKLLKITGMIMIIFGAISLLMNLFCLIGALDIDSSLLEESYSIYWIMLLVSFVASMLYLLLGMLGIINWHKPQKANICIILDIIFILLTLCNNIFSINISSISPVFYFSTIVSLILPILYLVAAFQLKKMGKQ